MDLKRLRQETATQHAATEETVPLMRDTLTRTEYAECLRRFYSVVHAWDTWCDAHAPVDLLPLLKGRRRADLLVNDLLYFGEPVPSVTSWDRMQQTVSGDPRSVFLGRMYVMEGSTLGGHYIAKHVEERLGLTLGEGDSFFVGYGDATAARWQEFRAVLVEVPDAEADTVIDSAKEMFEIFEEAMKICPEPDTARVSELDVAARERIVR
jgi:heme oxygenase (biliverdin-IX-beta and delta-forming)